MAVGQARLTPHRHSSGASPVCSPAAASRRAPHTSSRSRGCHLEDRKRRALSSSHAEAKVFCPGAQKPRDWEKEECVRVHTHRNQSWPRATDGTTVQRSTSYLTALLLSTSVAHSTPIVSTRCILFLTGSSYIT